MPFEKAYAKKITEAKIKQKENLYGVLRLYSAY
jgi:hypothetical protein